MVTLSELYDRYAARLFAYACVLTPSREEAEDVVQECFLRMSRRLERLAGLSNIEAYLLTMVRNEALRYGSRLRLWRRRNGAYEGVRLVEDDPARREDAERVQQAVRALKPEQREVVFLKIWEELTFAEIAEILGISPNTAASRYRYGVEHLRKRLRDE